MHAKFEGGVFKTALKWSGKNRDTIPVSLEPPAGEDAAIDAVEGKGKKGLNGRGPQDRGLNSYRFMAGLAYTTDVNGVTLKELSLRPPFVGVVSEKRLKKWAVEDHWKIRREALIAEWRKQIEAKMGQHVVKQAMSDLESTEEVFRGAIDKLRRNVANVASHEGLINSTVRLMEFRMNLRNQILVGVAPLPGNSGANSGQVSKLSLSAEDARVAALAIIHRRREEVRKEAAKRQEEAQQVEGESLSDSGTGEVLSGVAELSGNAK